MPVHAAGGRVPTRSRFTARDARGREVATSFYRWAVGKDWVPWNDESQFKMDVVPDRTRYSVGDTATVLFASPFTDAEAWITLEREGLLEQRRMRIDERDHDPQAAGDRGVRAQRLRVDRRGPGAKRPAGPVR